MLEGAYVDLSFAMAEDILRRSCSVLFVVLDLRDFIEASLMAATEVGGGQEGLHHFDGGFAGNNAAAKGEHVGVIVFAGEARGVHIMRECGANTRHFVRGNGNSNAGAANGDSQVRLVRNDSLADRLAVIGIVHGFFRGGS